MTRELFTLYATEVPTPLTGRQKLLLAVLVALGLLWLVAMMAMLGETGRESHVLMHRPLTLWEARAFYVVATAWQGFGYTWLAVKLAGWIIRRMKALSQET